MIYCTTTTAPHTATRVATRHLSREPSPPAVSSSPSLVPGFGSSRPSAFSIPRRPAFTTEAPLLVMR